MSFNAKLIKDFILSVNQDLFGVFLIIYIISLFVEDFNPGFINYSFNSNVLFFVTILSGVLIIFSKEKKGFGRLLKKDYVLIIVLGLAAGFLFYYKIESLKLSWYILISLIFSISIICFHAFLLKSLNDEKIF